LSGQPGLLRGICGGGIDIGQSSRALQVCWQCLGKGGKATPAGQFGRPLLVAHVSHMQYCMTQRQTCCGALGKGGKATPAVELATCQFGRPLLVAHVSHAVLHDSAANVLWCAGPVLQSSRSAGGCCSPNKAASCACARSFKSFFVGLCAWFVSTVPACHAVLALMQEGANSCCSHTFLRMLRSMQECCACSTACLQHRD
jgi:hypothetical protein